jgi:hypothetical protein
MVEHLDDSGVGAVNDNGGCGETSQTSRTSQSDYLASQTICRLYMGFKIKNSR